MRGIGEVYRAYADGALEDDDEVAVAHADEEHDFRATSDAMVDVRATIDAAVAAGVVGRRAAATILARVKASFYADRLLVASLDRDDPDHERLRDWLPGGWVRRKRADAVELLRAVAAELTAGGPPVRPAWTLQRTHYWEDACCSVELRADGLADDVPSPAADDELEALLDEARLHPDDYRLLLDRSLLAALARKAAAAAGVDGSAWARQVALVDERRQRNLLEAEDVDAWLAERDLDRTALPAVADRLAAVRWRHGAHRDAVAGEVALTVRLDDAYSELVARAARKRALLASLPADGESGLDDAGLVAWYFAEARARGPRCPRQVVGDAGVAERRRLPPGASRGAALSAGRRRRAVTAEPPVGSVYARTMRRGSVMRATRMILAALAFAGVWLWVGDGERILGPVVIVVAVTGSRP